MALKKTLIVGRDRDLQLLIQNISAEIFAADDLAEAINFTQNFNFDLILIESIFSPAKIQNFIAQTKVASKTVIIGAKNSSHDSQKDFLNVGVAAYLSDNDDLKNISSILKNKSKDRSENTENGFFFNALAASAQIAGRSTAAKQQLKMLSLVGKSNCNPVLIIGPSGTGKESAAKAIHLTRHADAPFIAVNCAALTANLLESELFGHVKGSFTGADRDKTGLIELAANGTLFLDEISEIPLELQAKLLRILQERTFRKVGGDKDIACQATIVASSNRNLKKEVADKKFRLDLYYRLNICPIVLQPLCSTKRSDDISLLAEYFLSISTICPQNSKRIKGFTPLAIESLLSYSWPGNIRELKNVIDRAILIESTDKIGVDSIIIDPAEGVFVGSNNSNSLQASSASSKVKDLTLVKAEQELIKKALIQAQGQKTKAASLLGITRATLYSKLKQYDIDSDGSTQQNVENLCASVA